LLRKTLLKGGKMRRIFIGVFLLLASYSLYGVDQVEKAKQSDDIVVVETDFGKIEFGLFKDVAPENVDSIVNLVKKGFYNGTTFHRIVPDFVIQGGDPLSKDNNPSNDGTGGPGYYVKDEYSEDVKHLEGTVALAKAADNQNGSQFYICLKKVPFLDGKYTIVGQVIEGMDVVHEIEKVKTQRERPIKNVTMKKVYMKEKEKIEEAPEITEEKEPEMTEEKMEEIKKKSGGGCGCGK
jgi:cyclophilin family peptidyl-prolyl cis-trans isomerase